MALEFESHSLGSGSMLLLTYWTYWLHFFFLCESPNPPLGSSAVGGGGEWDTWPAPASKGSPWSCCSRCQPVPLPALRRCAYYFSLHREIIKISKHTRQPGWQNSVTLLTLMFPTTLKGKASQSGPISQERLWSRGKWFTQYHLMSQWKHLCASAQEIRRILGAWRMRNPYSHQHRSSQSLLPGGGGLTPL